MQQQIHNPFEAIEQRLSYLESLLANRIEPTTTPVPDILDLNSLVEYIGNVSKGTVYQWMHRSFIPYFKIGKRAYFRRAEIDQWMMLHRKATQAERLERMTIKKA